jgi:hypothetical protein
MAVISGIFPETIADFWSGGPGQRKRFVRSIKEETSIACEGRPFMNPQTCAARPALLMSLDSVLRGPGPAAFGSKAALSAGRPRYQSHLGQEAQRERAGNLPFTRCVEPADQRGEEQPERQRVEHGRPVCITGPISALQGPSEER